MSEESKMSYKMLQLAVLLAVFAACWAGIKITPELEKCATQMLHMLAAETNPVYKEAIVKMIKHAKDGEIAAGQKVLLAVPEADRNAAIQKYLVGDCIPMGICLECPVEL